MKKTRISTTALDFDRPLVTVDVVIFSVLDDTLKVLMSRRPARVDERAEPFPGRWALPGGFVDVAQDCTLLDCAMRKLQAKTGVTAPYLEQLGSWGSADRDPRGWSTTHVYFALVHLPPAAWASDTTGLNESRWTAVDEALREPLAFDHNGLLAAAIARLRNKVEYTSLPAFFLPEPFTLPQLQYTYEVVLGRPVDKSAFRKRMLDAGFLEEAGMQGGATGRSAVAYRVKDRAQAVAFPRTFKVSE